MEIRDPIHDSIHIFDEEIPVIQNPFFQRLRRISQLGFVENIFPGATHTRFIHSLGVMHIGSQIFEKLFFGSFKNKKVKKMKMTFRMACLLHDIGHSPLSHATEIAMPKLSKLNIPQQFIINKEKKATHEDYTIKIITDSSFSNSLTLLKEEYGVEKEKIAELIIGKTTDAKYFTIDSINYFPLLHQLISGEIDCDRMDYLLRDSYFCGVNYGRFSLNWIIDNINKCIIDNKAFIAINERAVISFDDFLLGRYHMFIMVYFHYKSVCLEKLLIKYINTSNKEYTIPSDIEQYVEHDDDYLMKFLKNSKNNYAKDIVNNRIPDKIYESFNSKQLKILENIEKYLEQEDIEFIRSSSKGRISKYKDKQDSKNILKVIRTVNNKTKITDINNVTSIYKQFQENYEINRLHCYLDKIPFKQRKQIEQLSII